MLPPPTSPHVSLSDDQLSHYSLDTSTQKITTNDSDNTTERSNYYQNDFEGDNLIHVQIDDLSAEYVQSIGTGTNGISPTARVTSSTAAFPTGTRNSTFTISTTTTTAAAAVAPTAASINCTNSAGYAHENISSAPFNSLASSSSTWCSAYSISSSVSTSPLPPPHSPPYPLLPSGNVVNTGREDHGAVTPSASLHVSRLQITRRALRRWWCGACCGASKRGSSKRWLVETMTEGFSRYASFVYDHSWKFVVLSFLTCCLLGIGLNYRVTESQMYKLYSLPNTPAQEAKETLLKTFTPERISYIFAISNDNSLSKHTLQQLQLLNRQIANITIAKQNVTTDEFGNPLIIDDHTFSQIPDILSYQDLCVKDGDGDCSASSVLDMYYNERLYGRSLVSRDYPEIINFKTKQVYWIDALVGNITKDVRMQGGDELTVVTNATAFALRHDLTGANGLVHYSAAFEEELLRVANNFYIDNMNIVVKTERSINDELNRSSRMDFPDRMRLAIAVCLVIIYSVSVNTSCSFRNKSLAAFMGVIAALMGYVAATGLLHGCGLLHTPPAEATPFLVIGIGVDDVLVMLNSYSLTYMAQDSRERLQMTARDAGISITITTLTNIIAFIIGAVSPYFSVSGFCIITAFALFFGYLMCLTFFLGWLAIEARREERGAPFYWSKSAKKTSGREFTSNTFVPSSGGIERKNENDNIESDQCKNSGEDIINQHCSNEDYNEIPMNDNDVQASAVVTGRGRKGKGGRVGRSPYCLPHTRSCPPMQMGVRLCSGTMQGGTGESALGDAPHRVASSLPWPTLSSSGRSTYELVAQQLLYAEMREERKLVRSATVAVAPVAMEESWSRIEMTTTTTTSSTNFTTTTKKRGTSPTGKELDMLLRNGDRQMSEERVKCGKWGSFVPKQFQSSSSAALNDINAITSLGGAHRLVIAPDFPSACPVQKSSTAEATTEDTFSQNNTDMETCLADRIEDTDLFGVTAVVASHDSPSVLPFLQIGKDNLPTSASRPTASGCHRSAPPSPPLNGSSSHPSSIIREYADEYACLDEPPGTVGRKWRRFFLLYYGPLLRRWPYKIFVILCFAVYIAGAIYGLQTLKSGLSLKDITPDTSYLRDFYDARDTYFTGYGEEVLVFFPSVENWHITENQDRFLQLRDSIDRSEFCVAMVEGMGRFLEDRKNRLSPDDKANFTAELHDWLSTATGKQFRSHFQFSADGSELQAWKFYYWMPFIDNTRISYYWLEDVKTLLRHEDEYFEGIAFTPLSVMWESDPRILEYTLTNMVIALAAIIFVATLLIPDILSAALVVAMIVMVDLGLFGYMTYWNLDLNMLTMVNLLISIGFSVDYTAHMVHTFTHCVGPTREHRVIETLVIMGNPVTHGMVSTMLSVLMLSTADKYALVVFFEMMSMVLLFAYCHGVVLLPVLLSIFGPMPQKGAVIRRNLSTRESEHKERKNDAR